MLSYGYFFYFQFYSKLRFIPAKEKVSKGNGTWVKCRGNRDLVSKSPFPGSCTVCMQFLQKQTMSMKGLLPGPCWGFSSFETECPRFFLRTAYVISFWLTRSKLPDTRRAVLNVKYIVCTDNAGTECYVITGKNLHQSRRMHTLKSQILAQDPTGN